MPRSAEVEMKPSDFPRDEKFRDPRTRPFRDERGVVKESRLGDRAPNRHVGLGWAKHFCLGADLARLETRILLQEALRRLPDLSMDDEKPFRRFAGVVDGITEAHFRFDQQKAEAPAPTEKEMEHA
jgi:cytochrome P450